MENLNRLLSLVFVAGCAGGIDPDAETDADLRKCSSSNTLVYGVDVSSYQGSSINWQSVRAAGRHFAFAKASEGTGFTDPSFTHNWPGMKAAGVLRGAYHFFRPSIGGAAQADHFVDVINAHGGIGDGDLPPVADVEVSDSRSAATVIAELRSFLERVQARTGRKPMIYTANFFWGEYLGNPNFSSYPLWVANYGVSCPYLPNAFASWRFWQSTDSARVNGIPGGVDGDVFNGSIDELRAFAGGTAPAGGGVMFQSSRRTAINRDGRLEIFARAPDDAVWHDWQTAANGNWGGWSKLGGTTRSSPVVAANADGRLEVFVIRAGKLFHTFQLRGGGWYDGWVDSGSGNLVGEPAVGKNRDGRLEVFARSQSGALGHVWQTAPNGDWSAWSSLGGILHSDPAVGSNDDGRLEVFALGSDDRLYHIWQDGTPQQEWTGWAAFGGVRLQNTPHVGANGDGRLEVFATGADDHLHHIVQLPKGGWSGFLDGGSFGVIGEPAVTRNGDGRLEVFARGSDGRLWHLWQTAANGNWTDGVAMGGTDLTSDPDAAPNADGRLQVFWRGTKGSIETMVQLRAGGWSGVVDFGGNLAAF
jgi:GH25 family lysozyme M1 (1,4-beta-N-acetylmuramidase)